MEPAIRQLANEAFTAEDAGKPEEIHWRFLAAVNDGGSVASGRSVFAKHCSGCHRLDGLGFNVGPDLNALTYNDSSRLLDSILNPNREFGNQYLNYVVVLMDGSQLQGVITEETSVSLTLSERDGKSTRILRTEIDEIRGTGLSLMPERLDLEITPRSMADLICFLQSRRPGPKQMDGNQPTLVAQMKTGEVRLPANAAGIYGRDITYETAFGNIGYWHHFDDHAVWTARIERGGEFEMHLEFACADFAAGNQLLIDGLAQPQPIPFTVTSTGGWDRYVERSIGLINLDAGTYQIVIRPASPPRHALVDMKQLRLVPAFKR
jgi:putative heme-binding domain-containing protein